MTDQNYITEARAWLRKAGYWQNDADLLAAEFSRISLASRESERMRCAEEIAALRKAGQALFDACERAETGDRCWPFPREMFDWKAAVATPQSQAAGPTDVERDAARYRYLRDHCSSHYPMTWEQPAEWGISWEFQQGTPADRYGTFDSLIDRDIQARAKEDEAEPTDAAAQPSEGERL